MWNHGCFCWFQAGTSDISDRCQVGQLSGTDTGSFKGGKELVHYAGNHSGWGMPFIGIPQNTIPIHGLRKRKKVLLADPGLTDTDDVLPIVVKGTIAHVAPGVRRSVCSRINPEAVSHETTRLAPVWLMVSRGSTATWLEVLAKAASTLLKSFRAMRI